MDLFQVSFTDVSDPNAMVLKASYTQLGLSKSDAIEKATEQFHRDHPDAEIKDFLVHAYPLD
jgi:hypothetical protein